MTFKPGDEVVCVDDSEESDPCIGLVDGFVGDLDGLKTGRHYTIREVGIVDPLSGTACVTLIEIVREPDDYFDETPYAAYRFRPVRKTSIEIFTSMLTPTPTKETV